MRAQVGHRWASSGPVLGLGVMVLAVICSAGLARADVDPVVLFDGFEGCDPVHAQIGPAGGTLRLCGAVLRVPAGAVAEPTLFGIERLETPPPAPFDMEPAGPAFRFLPEDRVFAQPPSVRVPREDERRGGLAVDVGSASGMLLIEACEVSHGGVQQFVDVLGIFGAVRYAGTLPTSTSGLGSGTVKATVNGVSHDHDLDTPGNNWAVHQDLSGGARQVLMVAMKEFSDGSFEYVRLDFMVEPGSGTGSLQQISALGASNGSYIDGLLGSATLTLGDLSDGRLRGTITAELVSGPASIPFSADFDIVSERYYFPPSLSCPGGMPPG